MGIEAWWVGCTPEEYNGKYYDDEYEEYESEDDYEDDEEEGE